MKYSDENRARVEWQSARTRGGVVAPLPFDYWRAWDAAHQEKEQRERAEIDRKIQSKEFG